MKRIILIIGVAVAIATLFVRCSLVEEPEFKVDPLLQPYVEEFYNEMESRDIYKTKVNLIVRFGNENHTFHQGRQVIIEILKSQFDRYNNDVEHYLNFSIVSHEMGHALFKLKDVQGDEISLMNYSWTYTSYMKVPSTRKLFLDQLILKTNITQNQLWNTLNTH